MASLCRNEWLEMDGVAVDPPDMFGVAVVVVATDAGGAKPDAAAEVVVIPVGTRRSGGAMAVPVVEVGLVVEEGLAESSNTDPVEHVAIVHESEQT